MQSHSDNPLYLCSSLLPPHWLESIEVQLCDWPKSCLILQCLELDVTCNTGYKHVAAQGRVLFNLLKMLDEPFFCFRTFLLNQF